MATRKRLKQFGELEGAPDWYGTHLDKLDFEWSKDEKQEIERYCEKILKNIKEEDMTPLERWKNTYAGKPTDRALIYLMHNNVWGARTLDGFGDILKPADILRSPTLFVKKELANVARFKADWPQNYIISYGEECWGGNCKVTDYGGTAVLVGDPPIKTMKDAEALEAPDPRLDGLYPGYLWALRELRTIMNSYGLSKVMALQPCICGCPVGTAMMYMLGWAPFAGNLRKNPDLNRKCLEVHTKWEIAYGQAVIDEAKPDGLFMCVMAGASPPRTAKQDNTWLADYWARIGHALGPQVPIIYGHAFKLTTDWLPVMLEKGALGWDSFCGGAHDYQLDLQIMLDFHREHDLFLATDCSDKILLDGPVSAIEEDIKGLIARCGSYPRWSIGIGMVDYWTPPAHVDAAVAFARKYGKR